MSHYVSKGECIIYRLVFQKGEDFGYVAHCPAIPGCYSQGETMEEAILKISKMQFGAVSKPLDEALIPPSTQELNFVRNFRVMSPYSCVIQVNPEKGRPKKPAGIFKDWPFNDTWSVEKEGSIITLSPGS